MSTGERTAQTRTSTWGAKADVAMLLFAGLLVSIVGVGMAYAGWPADEVTAALGGNEVQETGSMAMVAVGSLLAAAGQAALLAGAVAVGVRLGNRP